MSDGSMSNGSRRQMVVSPRWMQGAMLTFVFAFSIMGYLTVRAYQDHAPVPSKIVSESGQVILTGEDIQRGQETFLTYGLMQFGSIYGHGAYLGPDFTADYLHRAALRMIETYGGDPAAEKKVSQEWQQNRYDFHHGLAAIMTASGAVISLAGIILWPWQPGTGLLLIAFLAGFASLVREGRRRWSSSFASEAE